MTKISALPSDTSPVSSDYMPIVQASSSTTSKVTLSDFLNFVRNTLTAFPTSSLSNNYKFSAYRSAAWTSAGSAYGKVPFDTKIFDTGNNFDAVTNNRFTAPVSGFYQFNAGVRSVAAAGALSGIAFYRNGTLANRVEIECGTNSTSVGPGISQVYQLAATDYIEVWHYGSASTGSTGDACFFGGFLVSAT